MPRFFPSLLLVLLAAGTPAFAQKIIEKNAALAAGQRVFLDLKQASSIRIRAGASGQFTLKATININHNRLNDALLLSVRPAAGELRVEADFDQQMLRNARPGDCASDTADRKGHNVWYGQQVCDDIAYEITLPATVALRVRTYSGNIDIAGLTGPIEAKSLGGFVDVAWPPTAGAEVALKTVTGEVYTDQDIAFSTARPEHPIVGYQLRGTLHGSGPLVRLESISNDVYFRRRR